MRIEKVLVISALVALVGCGTKADAQKELKTEKASGARITFVELGSVNCIPCKAMQPIMKSIEEKYGDQVEVVFYDVWQADQKKYAQEYKIKLIPTQVFLDADGTEIMRHEGFLPEEEIDAFLQERGLKPIKE
ncbi:thioredoxin family protein [candidate division KSB1 bacterium]|nr:thioredoxin family protein [candidate division KSB1 bacterium]